MGISKIFWVIFDPLELALISFFKYKIYPLFWYKVYPNQIIIKKTMFFFIFLFFILFFHRNLLIIQKKDTPNNFFFKSLKPYFSSDLGNLGTKIMCTSYIF